jgi:hypothetical protein
MRTHTTYYRSDAERYDEGFELGKAWAKSRAVARELERLDDLRDACVTDWHVLFDEYASDAFSAAERPQYVRGFVEGALHVRNGLVDGR